MHASEETHNLGRVIRGYGENDITSVPILVTYRVDGTDDGETVESVRFEEELSKDQRYCGKHLFMRIVFPDGLIRWREHFEDKLRERPVIKVYWDEDVIHRLMRAPNYVLGVLGLK